MEPNTSTQPRIADYIRPLKARWWLIVVAVVVATGGVYAFYAHKPNIYTTSTLVYVRDPGDPVTGLPSQAQTDRNVADQASLLYSQKTAAAVASNIDYPGTPQGLLQHVSIASKPGEDFVQVTAQAGTPQQAATIANAFARQLVASIDGAVTLRIDNALTLSKNQLAQLPRGPASEAQRANLQDQINRLQLAVQVPTTVARQVDAASPPGSPSSPKPLRNALFAFILSLVGAIALVYGLQRFDRRLKNPDDMETAYQRPLLGVLPHSGDPAPVKRGEPSLGPDFREPFRVLRTNLELASVDAPPRTIVVSSAIPGEGKSTVVRNLALAFRETGRRVAVVDLDLRHPALATLFGAKNGPGMTEVMRREAELDDAALRIGVGLPVLDDVLLRSSVGSPPPRASNGTNGTPPQQPDVTLLLGGTRPVNPPAVLASERLIEVLDELATRHDVVLIDSAPVLAVTDTVPLLRYADAALFVGRMNVTTRDTAKRLMEFLARVPNVTLLGVVANDLSRLEAQGYGYGYGYAYGAYRDDAKLETRRRKEADERAEQTA
jgi:non-specific protein-tyrosine kinase